MSFLKAKPRILPGGSSLCAFLKPRDLMRTNFSSLGNCSYKHHAAQPKPHSFGNTLPKESGRNRRVAELKLHRERAHALAPHAQSPLWTELEQYLNATCISPIEEDVECRRIQTICENSMNESSYLQNIVPELLPGVRATSSSRIIHWAFNKYCLNPRQHSLLCTSIPDIMLGFGRAYIEKEFPGVFAQASTRTSLVEDQKDMAFAFFAVEAKHSEKQLDIAREQNEKNRIVMLSSMSGFLKASEKPEVLRNLGVVTLTLAKGEAEAFLNWAYLDTYGNLIFPEPRRIRKWNLYKNFAQAKKEVNAVVDYVQSNTWRRIREALS